MFVLVIEALEFAEIQLRETPLPAEIRLLSRDESLDSGTDSVGAELRREVPNQVGKPVERRMIML
jgi:hypothetical protein